MSRNVWLVAVLLLALSPSPARADFMFTPMIGYPLGGDTLGRAHPAWVLSATWLDDEGFGLELDAGFAPHFFDDNGSVFTGTGSLITLMPNVLLTASPDERVVPYVTFGVGLMQMRVTSDNGTFTSTTREAGLNGGGGIFVFPKRAIGVRADFRYVRSLQNQEPSWTRGAGVDIAPGAFDFFRFTFGVTLRFEE